MYACSVCVCEYAYIEIGLDRENLSFLIVVLS